MPPRVHFTHHLCVAAGMSPPDWREFERAGNAAPPAHCPCHVDGAEARSTTTLRDVTCKWCLGSIARSHEIYGRLPRHAAKRLDVDLLVRYVRAKRWQSGMPPASLPEKTALAWYGCCRHRGVASPMSGRQTAAVFAAVEQETLVELLEKVQRHAQSTILHADARRRLMAHEMERLAELAPSLRAELQPGLSAALVAFDVLEEADRLLAAARTALGTVCQQHGARANTEIDGGGAFECDAIKAVLAAGDDRRADRATSTSTEAN